MDRLNDLWRWDGTDWTWISGSDTVNQNGIYGTLGTPELANVPGARQAAVSWTDTNGDLWLFGGNGLPRTGPSKGQLNDLWRWDGTNWTWISGSDARDQDGIYGTQGTADAANIPGGRLAAVSWTDTNGDLWLFGGWGYDSASSLSQLNDLWRWDGTNWTWISGSDTIDQPGSYGTQGTADAANAPGARYASMSWADASGNLWLFGGQGIDGGDLSGRLNDLWRWDGTNWTWISGSDTRNQDGIYGTQGTADAANVPGARTYGISWIDASGNLWAFGGFGIDSISNTNRLNDLWRYQP